MNVGPSRSEWIRAGCSAKTADAVGRPFTPRMMVSDTLFVEPAFSMRIVTQVVGIIVPPSVCRNFVTNPNRIRCDTSNIT